MTRDIILVHEDPGFIADFQEKLKRNGTSVTQIKTIGDLPEKADLSESVVVINAENDWNRVVRTLEALKSQDTPFYAVISETPLLEKTMTQIDATSERLALKGNPAPRNRRNTDQEESTLSFSDLLERRLAGFVKRVNASKGKNLHELLMQEMEKPLIKLALKETGGNQVRASELLGMHRNTLRKKMRELNISSAKKAKRT